MEGAARADLEKRATAGCSSFRGRECFIAGIVLRGLGVHLSNRNLGYLEESLVGWLKLRWAEGRLMADSGSSLGCCAHDLSSQIPGTPAFCQV